MKPKIVAVLGPTASGKTSTAIALAKEFNGEVISVDSRQIYKGMDIGTAKEPGQWQEYEGDRVLMIEGIPHWGIDLVEPNKEMSVAEFKEYAEGKIDEIIARGKLPILAGGTGFWVQAIVENLKIPEVEPDIVLRKTLENKSVDELFAMYREKDPVGAEAIDQNNKARLVRALEVCFKTGHPFSEQQKKGEPKYDTLQLAIEVDRDVLYDRINTRVEQMIEEGLVEEVKGLIEKYGSVPIAMTGIGYRQIIEHLETVGENHAVSLQDAIEKIKKDTRNYAKRQVSWFRRDESIKWVKDVDEAREICRDYRR